MTRYILRRVLEAVLTSVVSASVAASASYSYIDGAGEGFNDPTFGVQRKAAFENAVNIWTNQLAGSQVIKIEAEFNALGGTAFTAILGFAGPRVPISGASGLAANTWYASALADHIAGSDQDPGQPDIVCTFNSDVDNGTVLGAINWYYGLDSNPGSHIDFRSTVLHEIGHGLGFISLIETDGSIDSGLADIFSNQLATSPSSNPADGGRVNVQGMNNAQRQSAIISNQLYWKGANVLAARSNTMVKMYAPVSYAAGSSVSHWDTSNSAPDLLMEPFDTGPKSGIDLTKEGFQDLGWTFVGSGVDEWSLY